MGQVDKQQRWLVWSVQMRTDGGQFALGFSVANAIAVFSSIRGRYSLCPVRAARLPSSLCLRNVAVNGRTEPRDRPGGHGVDDESARAILPGFIRCPVQEMWYPGVTPAASSSVEGRLLRGLSEEEWRKLDLFEGDEYSLQQHHVR